MSEIPQDPPSPGLLDAAFEAQLTALMAAAGWRGVIVAGFPAAPDDAEVEAVACLGDLKNSDLGELALDLFAEILKRTAGADRVIAIVDFLDGFRTMVAALPTEATPSPAVQ